MPNLTLRYEFEFIDNLPHLGFSEVRARRSGDSTVATLLLSPTVLEPRARTLAMRRAARKFCELFLEHDLPLKDDE